MLIMLKLAFQCFNQLIAFKPVIINNVLKKCQNVEKSERDSDTYIDIEHVGCDSEDASSVALAYGIRGGTPHVLAPVT